MSSAPVTSVRLDTSITPALRDRILNAARAQGCSVDDFVAATLEAAVREDFAEVEVIRLSREASEQVAAALIDPPPLNEAMKRALARHRLMVRQG